MKCDEEKPHCRRCKSTGRQCEGYTPVPASRRELLTALREHNNAGLETDGKLSLAPRAGNFLSSHEVSQFDFFRMVTSPSTNAFLGSEFWSRSVLQLSHVEPAIKHAVLALSSLHRKAETTDLESAESQGWHRQSLIQYGNAVNSTQRLLVRAQTSGSSSDRTLVLASSLVLTIFDNLVGQYKAAQMHLQSGLRLAAEINKNQRHILPTMETTHREVCDLLARMDLQALTFSDASAPYPIRDAPKFGCDIAIPDSFSDFNQARGYLVHIMRSILRLGFLQENHVALEDLLDGERDCGERLKKWQKNFNVFLTQIEDSNTFEKKDSWNNAIVLLLKLYQNIAAIVIEAGLYGEETRWDRFMNAFRAAVDGCDQIVRPVSGIPCSTDFQMEQGPLMPLFLCASRCRDPVLRRRAIAMMRSTSRVEGCWESRGTAAVAERVMEVEERYSPCEVVTNAEDIPASARVHLIMTKVNLEERKVELQLLQKQEGADDWGPWNTVEETVYF